MLTDPLKFTMGDHKITSDSNSSGVAGTVCGILAGIIAIALAVVAIFFYQRRKFQKSANGVAFENPSYLREVNMEHVQVCENKYRQMVCKFFNYSIIVSDFGCIG